VDVDKIVSDLKMISKLSLVFIIFLLLPIAFAHSIEINEINSSPLRNLTFFTAFLGGILMFLAPCSFSLIPAYFAYSFKSRKEILLSTFIFFLGFSLMFSMFGFTAGFVGCILNEYRFSITYYLGIALVIVGLLLLFGKNFKFLKINWTPKKTLIGNFIFGIIYSFGFAGCAGPIFTGILLLSASQPPIISTLTMFSYALGLGIPLILISYFFDKFKLFNLKILEKSVINIGKISLPLSNLISSLLFIIIGVVFITNQNTVALQLANKELTDFSYHLQKIVLEASIPFGNFLFLFIFLGLVIFIINKSKYSLKGYINGRRKEKN
jgi:cytochrome c-type biogenesis protein